MKSVSNLAHEPRSLPLAAEDITEFHAARLLLLLAHCGSSNTVSGLTKLAKLDFFVRYPKFFERIATHLNQQTTAPLQANESEMVRHHYGPWDKRYYQILGFLEARGLIEVRKHNQSFDFELTQSGKSLAKSLSGEQTYRPLVAQMTAVKKLLGRKSGNQLKTLIYDVFDSEVGRRRRGEPIR
jgi:hypothetical protein